MFCVDKWPREQALKAGGNKGRDQEAAEESRVRGVMVPLTIPNAENATVGDLCKYLTYAVV